MAWIEVHQSLISHKKTILLADLLNVEEVHVVGHLVSFWLWCLDNAQDGSLDDITPRMIARAAQWRGDTDEFMDALVKAGFVESTDDGLEIHDWFDYAGRLIKKKEDNAQRMRDARTKRKRATHVQSTLYAQDEHMQNMLDARAGATNQPTNQTNQQHQPDMKSLLSLDDYCKEIQFSMIANGIRSSYIVQGNDYEQTNLLYASQVPIGFIKKWITETLTHKKDVKTFAYIAEIIKAKWANELLKDQPVNSIDFSSYREVIATKETRTGPYVPDEMPQDLIELEQKRKEMAELAKSGNES